ncbi:hypothetical protein R3P38DRAFT_3215335 [Favolaschia claudopus]|uniref:Uncharacterized protein n=1 Tax=Favolaschia claudopus TaxID=2862362 RepID=A0AAW0A8I1_9AGAR
MSSLSHMSAPPPNQLQAKRPSNAPTKQKKQSADDSDDESLEQFSKEELSEHAKTTRKNIDSKAKQARLDALKNLEFEPTILQSGANHILTTALVNFLPGIDSRSPEIRPIHNQRPLSSRNVNDIIHIGGPQGQGWLRQDPKHSLICLAFEKDIKIPESADPGSYILVQWSDDAKGSFFYLVAGQHRVAALRKVLEPSYQLWKEMPEGDEKEKLHQKLLVQGTWLVTFYNMDLLLDDNRETLLLQLFTNISLAPMKDTPSHFFSTLLRALRNSKNKQDEQSCLKYLQSTTSKEVKTLMDKYPDVCLVIRQLYAMEAFSLQGLTPRQWLDTQTVTWGMLVTFIKGGQCQLLYLTNLIHIPNPDSRLDLTSDLYDTTLSGEYSIDLWFANDIVDIAEDAFVNHLGPVIQYFGLEDCMPLQRAFQAYWTEICSSIGAWVLEAKKNKENTPDQLKVLKTLYKKLQYIVQGQFSGYPLFPDIKGRGIPLLCPSWLKALNSLLNTMAPTITFITSLFVPNILDQQSLRNGRTVDGEFLSHSDSLIHHMQCFKGWNVKGFNWSQTSAPNYKFIDEDWNLWVGALKVYGLLLTSRAKLLLSEAEIVAANTLPKAEPAFNPELYGFESDAHTTLLNFMSENLDSAKRCIKGHKGQKLDVITPRWVNAQPLVTWPTKKVGKQLEGFPDMVIQGLFRCSYNWLRSKGGTNTNTVHGRFAKHFIQEACLFRQRAELIEGDACLVGFVDELLAIMKNCDGLEFYRPWYKLAEPTSEDVECARAAGTDFELVANSASHKNIRMMDKNFHMAWKNLVIALSKSGIASISTPQGNVLHPGLVHGLQMSCAAHEDSKALHMGTLVNVEDLALPVTVDQDLRLDKEWDLPVGFGTMEDLLAAIEASLSLNKANQLKRKREENGEEEDEIEDDDDDEEKDDIEDEEPVAKKARTS